MLTCESPFVKIWTFTLPQFKKLSSIVGSFRHTDVIVTVFKSSEDLLQRLETKFEEDLLFLDIQIQGEMNGIELAHKIRELGLDTVIVFCTNFPQYVYEGYTVNALRFLPKPVSESDISYCCDYVYNRLSIESKNTLAIISAGKRYVLHYHEILYVEARSHCIYISTTNHLCTMENQCNFI